MPFWNGLTEGCLATGCPDLCHGSHGGSSPGLSLNKTQIRHEQFEQGQNNREKQVYQYIFTCPDNYKKI